MEPTTEDLIGLLADSFAIIDSLLQIVDQQYNRLQLYTDANAEAARQLNHQAEYVAWLSGVQQACREFKVKTFNVAGRMDSALEIHHPKYPRSRLQRDYEDLRRLG